MINYNDEKVPKYDLAYNRSLFRHYNLPEKNFAPQEPEFDLNEYFYFNKPEHRTPEEIPRASCSRRNRSFKCHRKPEHLYQTLPIGKLEGFKCDKNTNLPNQDNLSHKMEAYKQEPIEHVSSDEYLNNYQSFNHPNSSEHQPHSSQRGYGQKLVESCAESEDTPQPQLQQFNYFLLLFSQLIKQCQNNSNNIEKYRECLQQSQAQENQDYFKTVLGNYQEMLNNQQTKTEPMQTHEQDGKKDKPFVPYKKRNFALVDEASSSSNQSSNNSVGVKERPAKPKREVDPNQPKKIKRCPHVWQFCADLLDNENFNPSIIKWLNKDKGIFKIVKPDKVADLWGAQKNRKSDKKMNYEKMARGMRYSRREGFFKKLDKEKNKPNEYGKQLVFQFSDKVVRDFEWKWSFST